MKTTLEEIKNKVAKEHGFRDWDYFLNQVDGELSNCIASEIIDKAMEAAVNAKLQEAAERIKENHDKHPFDRWDEGYNSGVIAAEQTVLSLQIKQQ